MESLKTTDKTSSDIAGEVLWTRKITFQATFFLISFLVLFSRICIFNPTRLDSNGPQWGIE